MPNIVATQPSILLQAIRDRLLDGVAPSAVLVDSADDEPSAPPADLFATVAMESGGQPDDHLHSFDGDDNHETESDPFILEAEVTVTLWQRYEVDVAGTSDARQPLMLEAIRIAMYKLHGYEPPDPDNPTATIVMQPLVFKGWNYRGPGRGNGAWRRWALRLAVTLQWDFRTT